MRIEDAPGERYARAPVGEREPGGRSHFGVCPACRREVGVEDDFARLGAALYHLSCMLTALRELGERSSRGLSLRHGIAALGHLRDSGRLATTSP